MARDVITRTELAQGRLDLGAVQVDLADYMTTGLRVACVGPSGIGKTNVALVLADQLSKQGWVSVLIDPEGEIESLYGPALDGPEDLAQRLQERDQPIVVVRAKDASEFVPYGRVLLHAADEFRKPVFLVLDEGQLFSAPRARQGDIGEAADIVNDLTQRGRKRALDLCITALRFSNSLHRAVFSGTNLLLVGSQQDPAAWPALAPKFKGTGLDFNDLMALAPGEFFVFNRRGVDKTRVPMDAKLKAVAVKVKIVRPALPSTYSQWDRAMRGIPTERLQRLEPEVVSLLAVVAGLTPQQMSIGTSALRDELALRD